MLDRLRMWLVGASIRINDQVKDRMLALEKIQARLRSQKRDDLRLDEEPVDVRVRNFARGLESVDGQVVGLELEAYQMPAERAHLHAATGRLLKRRNKLISDPGFELRRCRIPPDHPNGRGHQRD